MVRHVFTLPGLDEKHGETLFQYDETSFRSGKIPAPRLPFTHKIGIGFSNSRFERRPSQGE